MCFCVFLCVFVCFCVFVSLTRFLLCIASTAIAHFNITLRRDSGSIYAVVVVMLVQVCISGYKWMRVCVGVFLSVCVYKYKYVHM